MPRFSLQNKRQVLGLIVANIGFSLSLCQAQQPSFKDSPTSQVLVQRASDFHKGICVEGGPALLFCHANELVSLGATHISLNPFGWMNGIDQPQVLTRTGSRGNPESRWWGESDEGLLAYTQQAQANGLRVMLRPHIWLRKNTNANGDSVWLGDIWFESEADWAIFEQSYTDYALHYARLAEQGNMEWYSIGAEMTLISTNRPDYWRGLIKQIRAVYSGKLIYSANWYQEVEGITFWDDLDAIGVQAYFPIADEELPSNEELRAGWQPHLAMLKTLAEKTNRPVIFTEIGYKSTTCAAESPWEWEGRGAIDPDFQARCYQVTLDVLKDQPWLQGLYWWKYHVNPCNKLGQLPRRGEGSFTFQGKPATQVLQKVFNAR